MAIVGASKSELLEWINSYFNLNYSKIEACGNGVPYVLIFNALYPNTINIQRLIQNPQTEFQIQNNFKLLQHGFNKVGISREVNVERLMKCRLQDNLEFLQWFGKLWCEFNKDFTFASLSNRPTSRHSLVSSTSRSRSRQSSASSRPSISASGSTQTTSNTTTTSSVSSSTLKQASRISSHNTPLNSHQTNQRQPQQKQQQQQQQQQQEQILKLKKELSSLNSTLDDMINLKNGLEIERDFYFNKLRDIEIICQDIKHSKNAANISVLDLVGDLMEIMYTTEDGFLPPDQELTDHEFENNTYHNLSNNTTNQSTLLDNQKINNASTPEKDLSIDNTRFSILNDHIDHSKVELFDDETF
ncbi:hypothetical protein CANINC_001026 [Pichia inconspicua]|uniref:Calponin-homology (CH) domain-containing protein n=1 Tax=Pichia inconspicua TaxID=52247 RepID=A0A4T0X5X1_9ASCO|nr:hypothetical protein CANINC_001026 [[Candida] inconspicua]